MNLPVIENRPYQTRAIEMAIDAASRGIRRMILNAPTGSGKTLIAVLLILRALAKNKRVLFVAHRRELVMQCYRKLLWAGVPASKLSILLGSEKNMYRSGAPVQIASIQSLAHATLPEADVVFVDECHLAASASFVRLLEQYPNATIFGLTATAVRTDGRALGDVFDEIIVVAQNSELIAGGWIEPIEIFRVPPEHMPDLDGVSIDHGDYNEDESAERVRKARVFGDAPAHLAAHARGLRAMAFAPNIATSRELAELYKGAGFRAVHLDGSMAKSTREEVLADLEHGRIDIVCNCGLYIEGLDIAAIKCIVMMRPTKSVVVHCQTAGRAVRPWMGIKPILLDHVGNTLRRELGAPDRDREYSLDGRPSSRGSGGFLGRKCERCGHRTMEPGVEACEACGMAFPKMRTEFSHEKDIRLEFAGDARANVSEKTKRSMYDRFWALARRDEKDATWVNERYVERFGQQPPADWTAPPIETRADAPDDERIAALASIRREAEERGRDAEWVAARYAEVFCEQPTALEVRAKSSRGATRQKMSEGKTLPTKKDIRPMAEIDAERAERREDRIADAIAKVDISDW